MAFTPALPSSTGYPTPRQNDMYVRKWQPDPAMFRGSALMPIQNHYVPIVEWDEMEAVQGMTPAHSLDADPQSLALRPMNHKTESSLYFKETGKLKESDFLNTRAAGTQSALAGRQLVTDLNDQLNLRLDARIEWARWQAIQGSLALNENGIKRTITYGVNSLVTPSTPWSTVASSTPISDIQGAMRGLRGKGQGACTLWVNQYTAEILANNTAFVTRVQQQAGSGFQLSPDNLNAAFALLVGGGLRVEVYDEGYTDTNGDYQPFIPNNRALLIKGTPKGQPLGAIKTTPSIHNGGPENPLPGRFAITDDSQIRSRNPRYEVTVGMYFVPILLFPQCITPIVVA